MAISNNLELFDSQEATHSRTGSNQERKYLLTGTEDTDEAAGFAAVNLPATVPGLFGSTLSLQDFRIAHQGGGVHEVSAKYASQAPEFSFDTTAGGSTRITQSRKTLRRYGRPGEPVPDFKGAINVTDDSIEGVDIPVAGVKFTEKHFFTRSDFTPEFKDVVATLTDRINDAPFRHYKTGEVRFGGMSSSQRGIEDVEGSFQFEVSRDDYGIRIGDIGLEWLDKDDIDDAFAEDDDVYRTPGGKAAPTAGSTNNRLLEVDHEASVPGQTDVHAAGPLEKLNEADVFLAGATVYLDPAGFAVLTNGGGVNVGVGLAQADSDATDTTVLIDHTFTKADPDQAFDVATPLWVRNDGTADNRSAYDANTIYGKAYQASAVGATQVRVMTIRKGGWEYLWIRYLTDKDENHLVKTPTSVSVERVFLSGDFSALNIGTGPT